MSSRISPGEVSQGGEDRSKYPQDRSGNPGNDRNVSGNEDKKDESNVSHTDDREIDPIADLVAGPVQRKADDNGCNRKSNQVPRALKEPSPGHSRLQQYGVEIHAIRRTKVEYSPDDIADGSDLVHG